MRYCVREPGRPNRSVFNAQGIALQQAAKTMTMAALKELRIAEEQPRQRRRLWPT